MKTVAFSGGVERAGLMARGTFPAHVAIAAIDPRLDHAGLMPVEWPAVARMVERRRREYTAGRVAARRAMAELGFSEQAVPTGPDRAPIWPNGLVGSISHTGDCCIAAVARVESFRSIGIDVETDEPLPDALIESVCTPMEAAWLERRPPEQRGRLMKVIFSAKECIYKCQFAVTRTLIDFMAIQILLDVGHRRFSAIFQQDVEELSRGHRIRGNFHVGDGLVVVGATMPVAGAVRSPNNLPLNEDS